MSRNPAGLLCYSRLGAKGRSCGSAVSSTKSQILSASLNLATVIRERKVCNSIASVRGNSAPSVTVSLSKGSDPLQVLWLQNRLAYKSFVAVGAYCGPSYRHRPHFNFFDVSPVALSLDRSCRSVVSSSSLLLAHSSWLYVSC